jgi:hypothetical protein
MDGMNDDDKFDMWLKDTAQAYNRPPAEVPREEMWQVITAATPHVGAPATPAGRFRRRVAPWQYAAAAVLILAVGISIGRLWPGSTPSGMAPVASAPTPAPAAGVAPSYQIATTQHLTSAEALLTSFRRAQDDAGLTALQGPARNLLMDTRLLLDSPAATDPRQRRLLEDLELALAQIVQLSPDASASDRTFLQRSLERGEILTRIRTTLPAGIISGT